MKRKITIEIDELYGRVFTCTAVGTDSLGGMHATTVAIDLTKTNKIIIDNYGVAHTSWEGEDEQAEKGR